MSESIRMLFVCVRARMLKRVLLVSCSSLTTKAAYFQFITSKRLQRLYHIEAATAFWQPGTSIHSVAYLYTIPYDRRFVKSRDVGLAGHLLRSASRL